ncbi:MAG: glycosyltransferase family 2 protein [Gemmataceae bacterium]
MHRQLELQDVLRRCLASLTPRRQGLPLEVIVVDNASADGAADMVEQEFPRVRLVRNDANVGFARGCNQGARLARGRYLFFLNNDTVVPRGALARLVGFARPRRAVGLVGPRLRDGSGRIQCSARQRPTVAALLHRLTLLRWTGLFRAAYREYRGRGIDAKTTRPVEVLMGAALLMPRRVYRAVGGWDEGYTFGGEDIELCARVARTHEVVYYPAVEVLHLGRESSREHTGYATANTLVGVTRSMRQTGTPGLALAAYKLAFTLDLPLRAAVLGTRHLVASMRGKERAALRARRELVGLAYFVRHALGAFWRA